MPWWILIEACLIMLYCGVIFFLLNRLAIVCVTIFYHFKNEIMIHASGSFLSWRCLTSLPRAQLNRPLAPRAIVIMQKWKHKALESKCGLCLPQSWRLSPGIMMAMAEWFVGYKCLIEGVMEINWSQQGLGSQARSVYFGPNSTHANTENVY